MDFFYNLCRVCALQHLHQGAPVFAEKGKKRKRFILWEDQVFGIFKLTYEMFRF